MDMLSDIADAYHSSDFFQVLQLHLDIIIRTDLILQIAILNEIFKSYGHQDVVFSRVIGQRKIGINRHKSST